MRSTVLSCAFSAWIVLGLLARAPIEAGAILVAGGCTLPDAITAAEMDTSWLGCSAGSGADVIHLGEDVLLTSVGPVGGGTGALPLVTTPITIRGNGYAVRMASGVSGKIFTVDDTGDLTLTSILIEDSLQVAIYNTGTLTIRGSTLRNNAGAINCAISSSVCDIRDSSLIDNSRTGNGGAIFATGTLTVRRSTFSGNSSIVPAGLTGGGGAIRTGGGAPTTIADSLFEDNSVISTNGLVRGGAIFVEGGPGSVLIERSTFVRNTASGGNGFGGGVAVKRATKIINSTFTENSAVGTATGAGGGVFINSPFAVEVTNSTFVDNSAGGSDGRAIHALDHVPVTPITIRNVVAMGGSPGCVGTMIDGGGNLGCLGGPAVSGLDPMLSDNGGATPTHALLPGSNAIDNGGASCGTSTDQRWVNRSGNCDSGAFEFGGCADDYHEALGDDSCYGVRIDRSGVVQSHRMCNRDWVFFDALLFVNYTILTSNLQGGADTLIRTARDCGGPVLPTLLDTDDNSGGGLASRLELAGIGDLVGVLVTDVSGVYDPGKSYDITVTCTGCGCSAPDGANLDLTTGGVSGARAYEVCEELSAGGFFGVDPGGILLLSAGERVTFTNGFNVLDGGRLIVIQDSDLKPAI